MLPGTQELLRQVTKQGCSLGVESITGNYLSSCLNQLELSMILVHAKNQLSPKEKLLGKALEEVAKALNIAVCKI
jgi:hypothetical protein